MSHAVGRRRPAARRRRPGDAPAAREHARARPFGLPAAHRGAAARPPCARASSRSCRSRAASGRPAISRRSRISRCRSSGAARSGWRPTPQSEALLAALREAGLEPLVLEAKEGLALLNGTQLMSAIGALLLADAERLVRTASVAAAMSVEALLGTDVAFAEAYQLARPHPGQVEVAAQLRWLLRDSSLMASHHPPTHKVQDPYSIRCVPQVHGAVLDALDHLRRVLDIELNAATDNPLVFPEGGVADADAAATGGGLVISGGNFHGEPIALALDFAKLARRRARLDQRTADGAPARRRACRRPAAVPHRRRRPELRADARCSTRRRRSRRRTRCWRTRHRSTRSRPAPTRRTTSRWAPPRPCTAGACSANVEQVLAIELLCAAQALDLRLATPARDPSPAPACARRMRASAPGSRTSTTIASSGPTSAPPSSSSDPAPSPPGGLTLDRP